MIEGVVYSFEYNILERQPSLVAEVLLAQKLYNLFYGITFFGGHKFAALFGQRVVQTDGYMVVACFEQWLKAFAQSHCRDGYAVGAHGCAVVRR